MTPQEQVQVAAVLAGILEVAQKLSGRIRVQKLTYLLQQKGLSDLAEVEFVYHHYGPYSEDVADVLSRAVRSGVFAEKAESFDDEWQRYEYSLGRDSAAYISSLSTESRQIIRSTVSLTAGLHWRVLELAATALFLKKRDVSSLDDAVSQAISLKPGCRGYEATAVGLLQKLELN
jgi:uncharacterized protein YwgA